MRDTQHGRMARQQARRQRRERAAGVAVVCLGIIVLIVAIAALREPDGHVSHTAAAKGSASSVAKQTRTTSAARTPSKARASSSSVAHGVKDVPLVVLNNTTIKGLATQAAARFESGGWKVTSSGNLTNEIISTCAYYDAGDPQAKAAALALQAQYPAIKRVEPKFPQLPSGPVVVVLTPDYSAA